MWNSNDSKMQNEGGYFDSNTTINCTTSGNNSSVKRGNVCVPVMIAHLNRYADELEVWGMPAGLVSFVAILTKVDAASTRIHYEFRDETGTIKGIKWINSEDAVGYACPVQINSYARVYGQARKQNDEAHVLVMSIQPLEHLMELLAHLMEVTVMCLEGNKAASNVNQHDTSLMHHQNDNIVENKANSHIPSGLNRDQGQVYSIIFEKSETEEYGIDRNEIKSKVPQSLISKVDDILDFLSAEGHVYTTITDDHFKVIS
ncbi:hypothetical protein QAD02_016031 [Eretmocerus hayati]|uniref:Uncharacterized protein n=1 Tax=Eretmocerus hayati TaxID=131215 RepID=A0ACC2P9F1_9HYME|nr:hypothetical protein QAD02_016031 [Eretmocerus hayati]